jgi:hypothetical protein
MRQLCRVLGLEASSKYYYCAPLVVGRYCIMIFSSAWKCEYTEGMNILPSSYSFNSEYSISPDECYLQGDLPRYSYFVA